MEITEHNHNAKSIRQSVDLLMDRRSEARPMIVGFALCEFRIKAYVMHLPPVRFGFRPRGCAAGNPVKPGPQ